ASARQSTPAARQTILAVAMAPVGLPVTRFLLSSVGDPFSSPHFPGHCFRLIPASGSFAASAFPVPPLHHWVPSHKAAARFGSTSPRFWGAPEKWGRKRRHFHVLLELSNDRRICWGRPRAGSSAKQRLKI